MANKKAKDAEVTAYIDTLPNLVRLRLTKEVEEVPKERFEARAGDTLEVTKELRLTRKRKKKMRNSTR